MKEKTKFLFLCYFNFPAHSTTAPPPPQKTITTVILGSTTPYRDLGSPEYSEAVPAVCRRIPKWRKRRKFHTEAPRHKSTGPVWDFTSRSLWLVTIFLIRTEQEVVVGEDEKGIGFHVEILFPQRAVLSLLAHYKVFGLNLDLLPDNFPFHSYSWTACNPWTPKECSLEKSLREYFAKGTETWPSIVALVNNATHSHFPAPSLLALDSIGGL